MSPRHRRLLPWIALGLVYLVWGSTYLAIRIAVREVPPFGAGALRFFASGLAMTGIAVIVDRRHGWPTWRQVADYSLVGVLLLAIGNVLVMWAEKTIPSGIAALIVGTTPLWLTFLDGLRPGGQRWTPALWAGTLIGLGGVALVARPEGGIQAGHWGAVIARSARSPGRSGRSTRSRCRPACPSSPRPRSRCWPDPPCSSSNRSCSSATTGAPSAPPARTPG
jgi:drug/metabolite transporter (DMT)-like permease